MTRVIALIASAFLLTGCLATVRDTVGGYFAPQAEAARVPSPPKYCYRTLGKVNCYARPLPAGEANRLVGYDGTAPRAAAGTGPLRP